MEHSEGNLSDGGGLMSVQNTGDGGLIRLAGSTSKPEVSADAVRAIPADFAKRHRIVPVSIDASTIRILTASPGQQQVIDDIRLLTGLEVEESEAPAAEVVERIAQCYQVTVERMIENLSPERTTNGDGKNLHDIE